jgi:hypothetical protein
MTHYETLGVSPKATAAEIRSAYRKLVLIHHPDRSKAADASARFARISEAYQVLSDPERRRSYDNSLVLAREREARAAQRATVAAETTPPSSKRLDAHPREAMAYAVLGDIARTRGEVNHAANMYAHAAQMEPRNPLYQQRYEEMLSRAAPGVTASMGASRQLSAVWGSAALCLVAACYIALARERPIAPIGLSLGAMVMLFLSGVVTGAAYSLGGVVDRFNGVTASSSGRLSPLLGFSAIALVSFWAAAALYGLIALTQRSFSPSLNRIIGATTAVVAAGFIAVQVSPMLAPMGMLLWGGNFVYLGAIAGWATADALRPVA